MQAAENAFTQMVAVRALKGEQLFSYNDGFIAQHMGKMHEVAPHFVDTALRDKSITILQKMQEHGYINVTPVGDEYRLEYFAKAPGGGPVGATIGFCVGYFGSWIGQKMAKKVVGKTVEVVTGSKEAGQATEVGLELVEHLMEGTGANHAVNLKAGLATGIYFAVSIPF